MKMDISVRGHARLRMLGRKWIRRDVRRGSGEPPVQCGFARVRRPDQCDLRGAFRSDHLRGTTVTATLLPAFQLFCEVLDAGFDIRM
jgi:hypothetical protein